MKWIRYQRASVQKDMTERFRGARPTQFVRRPHQFDWLMTFDNGCWAMLGLWRLGDPNRIIAGSEDHIDGDDAEVATIAHDAAQTTMQLLLGQTVKAIIVAPRTSDLHIAFTGKLQLDGLVCSRRYECWELGKSDDPSASVVGPIFSVTA